MIKMKVYLILHYPIEILLEIPKQLKVVQVTRIIVSYIIVMILQVKR